MRDKKSNRDYIQKYRFRQKMAEMLRKHSVCEVCFNALAQTLHHIDEDHSNNKSSNLLPICRKCHLEMKHKVDDKPQKGDSKPLASPERRVTVEKTQRERFLI